MPRRSETNSRRGVTWERLRKDIDSGLTGDKVNFPDPATAPLGTDSEAAGIPTDPTAISDAHRYETRNLEAPKQDRGAALYVAFIVIIGCSLGIALVLSH